MKQICIPVLGLILSALVLLTGCSEKPLQGGTPANPQFALGNDVTAIAQKWVMISDAPGAIIAIGMPDGRIWQKAIGVAENVTTTKEFDVAYSDDVTNASDGTIPWRGRPMTADMYMRIGSRSKGFTAALIMKLHEEGLIDLDKYADDYLTPGLVPNGDKVTVRMLLDMTSGIDDYLASFSPFDLSKPSTGDEILRFVRTLPNGGIRYAPGETVFYSNTNYIILGMIAEKVTGKSFRDLLQNKVLSPLGLRHTMVPDPNTPTLPTPYACGYKIDLPWDMWLSLWRAENTTPAEALVYLEANQPLVEAYAAQNMTVVHTYPDWITLYLQANPMAEINAYIYFHPGLIDDLKAYKSGDAHALDSYPAPLVQVLISTNGLIDSLIGGKSTRKLGVSWYDSTEMYTSAVAPVGGVISTAADQVQWIRAVEEGNFFSSATQQLREQAWHPYPLVSNAKWDGYYGFGTYKKIHRATGNTLIGHGGRIQGYDSYGYLWKEKNWTVVVLVNALNLNLRETYDGYPAGSIAGIIGEEIMDELMAKAQ